MTLEWTKISWFDRPGVDLGLLAIHNIFTIPLIFH
jgi:hypothetical protein